MTHPLLNRPMTLVATLAITAGIATAAWAAGPEPDAALRATATVVADLDAPDAAVARAVDAAADRAQADPAAIDVYRVGGSLEANAAIAELASTHSAVIAGVGRDARAAVGQAEGAELAPSTAWVSVR